MENKENKTEKTITDEELRRQIKGNLMIVADTWPIHQLQGLEDNANATAMAGIFAEGLLYSGIMDIYGVIYDKAGKVKLSSNPDDANNIFKVLGEQIAKNNTRQAEDEVKDESGAEAKTEDTESGFNFF